jgi:porin
VADHWLPFLRAGHSDGGGDVPARNYAACGFEYSPRPNQALSLAFGWADPSDKTFGEDLEDESVIETSYLVQVSPNLSLMPDVQLLLDPSLNPDENSIWVFGFRVIVTL